MIKYQLFIAMALLVGVAIGFFAAEPAPAKVEEPAPKHEKGPAVKDAKDESATIAALRREIADLRKSLAAKESEGEERAVSESSTVEQARVSPPPERPRNPREWMENLKKTDPERYTQTTNRMAQWRRSRAERAQTTLGFLSSVDTSRMSAGAKKTHAALQDLIAKREEIEASLHQEDLSDEERGQLMGELRSTHHEMMRLNAEERKNLFEETARNLGFEGQDVKDITETIQEVIDATDGGWGPRRGGHHGGPRGQQGGPGGR